MLFPKSDRDAVIVAACRTPIGKVSKGGGALHAVRPEDLGAQVLGELFRRLPALRVGDIEDVIFGCAVPEREQGMNIGRNIPLRAGLPNSVPGITVSRFCASGLEAIRDGACRIRAGLAETIIAGGVESMSMLMPTLLPMLSPAQQSPEHTQRLHPRLLRDTQVFITTMGGAEVLRKAYHIPRKEQDIFAIESHRKAVAAQDAGRFADEIVPVKDSEGKILLQADDGPRRDSTLEKLETLNPVVKEYGCTVTAGNASQTSDGAAAVALMSRARAAELGVKPMARFVDYTIAGVAPEYFGIGPFDAIRAITRRTGLSLGDIGLVELNEAFAAQVLAVLRCIYIDRDKLNVNGGAIALGHPLGCTGARIAATLIYEMRRRGVEFGLETMCIGGGMGAAALFQLED
ncbi:MAG: thiolase family protein [bacterium]|nr:thiolase family protein [bacterium]